MPRGRQRGSTVINGKVVGPEDAQAQPVAGSDDAAPDDASVTPHAGDVQPSTEGTTTTPEPTKRGPGRPRKVQGQAFHRDPSAVIPYLAC